MNLFKVARNAVSKDKFRFQDGWFDLDLTYITSRIIAMGIPGQKMDKIWRNDGDDVATFLWFYHAKHFMVFNLSGEEYDYAKFDNRVLDFGFPDHSACPLALLFQVVEAMKKWLSEDEENVAVVHCLAGRGRTGMVISTYLLREGFFRDAKAALKFFAEARSATAAGVLTPSQIRFTHYANEIYRSRIDPPFGKERPLVLRKIVISPFPVIPDADDAQRMGGWEPVIKVFTLKGHHKETNNERLLYSSDYHPTKLYYSKPGNIRVVREVDNGTVNQEKERIRSKMKQREKIVVDITKGCFVRGDIQLKFFHQASSRISFARILKSGYLKTVEVLSTALSKKYPYVCLFRLSFHTSFVGRQLNEIIAKQRESNDSAGMTGSMGESYDGGNGMVSWTLRKEELDAMFSGPAHTKMLPDDFSIKLVFSDPDADDIPRLSASSSSSSSPSTSNSTSTSSVASMRESNGSRSLPKLPALPPLPSVDKTTSAVASLALSPRGPEQREKLAQRRTGDGRTNARSVNFGGGKYKEAEHQPPPTRAQRGTISYSSIKRHATGPLQNEKRAQQRAIDFEDIFLKTPPPTASSTSSSAAAASRDRSNQRISESTEPTFPSASAMRRRSSLPSDSEHQAVAAAAASAAQRKTITPSPSRAVTSRERARPEPGFPSLPTPPSSGGHGQPPQTTRTAPHPAPPPQSERGAVRPTDILTTTPARNSLHSPLRPTPPSSSTNMSTPPNPSSSSPSSATSQSVTSPPASMTPPTSGPPLSSGHYPASTLAAAHNRQSLLQSYPPMHPTLTPTPAMSASSAVAPVSAPIPSPAHTAVLTPMPSHPMGGGGQPPLNQPHSAPAHFVPGAGGGSGSIQLHAPLTPTLIRHDVHHPTMPSNNSAPYASSGALPARASMAMGHGHVPLQPSPALSNGNAGHPPGSAGNFHPQQSHPQQFPQQFLTLHPPLQPEPVTHDFSSRLPPVCFPQASSAQPVDEARERIRQQIVAERQRALYPHQQPYQQQQQQQQQPERARDYYNSVANNHSTNYSNGVGNGNGSRPPSSSPTDRGRDREDRDRQRDETERESMDRREMERRRQDDERMRREWEQERAAAGRGGQSQGRGRGDDDRRGGRGGPAAGGAPRGSGRGDGRGARGSGASPQRTYRISDMQ